MNNRPCPTSEVDCRKQAYEGSLSDFWEQWGRNVGIRRYSRAREGCEQLGRVHDHCSQPPGNGQGTAWL